MVNLVAATASFIVQVLALALLFVAYALKAKKNYRGHGIAMMIAVVLHLLTIFAVMVPSLIFSFSLPGTINYTDVIVIIVLTHALLGVIAASVGVWLVSSWRLRKELGPCFAKKRFMLPTLMVWIMEILIGVYIYVSYYLTMLFL